MATQNLAAVSASIGLMGNEFDECLDSDEAKFTAPVSAFLNNKQILLLFANVVDQN